MKSQLKILFLTVLACFPAIGQVEAKNVIVFFGDGVGISSLNAASILGHKTPQSLYVQHMPHLALADTSSSAQWVTDAGAAATAMATGGKTANRMVPAFPEHGPPPRQGWSGKTILEYAEERGLATGLISDVSLVDPLVSAFYAHQDDRNKTAEVFLQILAPRFGDGVDVAVGGGRKKLLEALGPRAEKLPSELAAKGYVFSDTPRALDAGKRERYVIAFEDPQFDLADAVHRTIDILSRNPKGFFLAVHYDCHVKDAAKSLDRVLTLDKVVQAVAERHSHDSLVLVTADHA
jgi:alkaline phosphatase